MFSCVAGFSNIFSFIAGKIRTGHSAASTADVRRLSAIPWAIFASVFALHGAITKTSAHELNFMCGIEESKFPSELILCPERVSRAIGATKFFAVSVMIISASFSDFLINLTSEGIL